MSKKVFVDTVAFLYMILFAYTAAMKLMEQTKFVNTLLKAPLVAGFADIISWAVPLVEIVLFLLLFIPRTKKIGLYASTGLVVIFTLYIGYMMLFAKTLPCACGGVISKLSWGEHLIFNLVFILLGFWAIRFFGQIGNIHLRRRKRFSTSI